MSQKEKFKWWYSLIMEGGYKQKEWWLINIINLFKQQVEMEDRDQELQRIESLKSLNSNSELNSIRNGQEDKMITDGDHLYQIDIKPQASSINRDEILKIFKQLQGDEPALRNNKSKKQPQLAKKKSQHKPPIPSKKTQFSHLSQKAKEKVDKMLKSYRAMFRPSTGDTQVRKFGYEHKQKIFLNLLYGIEELKILPKQQLSELEDKITNYNQKEAFEFVKRIAAEIDRSMIELLNKSSKGGNASRQYRLQWGNLASNIRDQKNSELRRKILNKTLTPQKIAQAKQIELYTTAKREEIFRKQKQYLAEFEKQDQQIVGTVFQAEEIIDQPIIPNSLSGKQDELHKGSSKYLEEGTISQLKSLVGIDQIMKMKKRIEDDLTENTRSRLVQNIRKIFRLNS